MSHQIFIVLFRLTVMLKNSFMDNFSRAFELNDTQRERLCFIQFSTRIY